MTISHYEENKDIEITAVYFRNDGTKRLESYPKRMVLDGREYTFLESGMRYLVRKGQELISLFDVSDGQTTYRLRHDDTDHWTLVNIKTA